MAVKLQLRRDTTANWSASNPILAEGEVGIDTTVKLAKIGDGTTAWNSLAFGFGDSNVQSDDIIDIVVLTQAAYDALGSYGSSTMYVIVG
jgi:hypothetical protein